MNGHYLNYGLNGPTTRKSVGRICDLVIKSAVIDNGLKIVAREKNRGENYNFCFGTTDQKDFMDRMKVSLPIDLEGKMVNGYLHTYKQNDLLLEIIVL